MQNLLRKLFFWDEPAQGAFFGLTLLPVMVWLAFSVFCCILVINYSLLWKFAVIASLAFAMLGILAYVLVLEIRMQILLHRKIGSNWKRIWIPMALFALSLVYAALVSFMDVMHWKGLMCVALILGYILWNYKFFVVSWKNLAGTLAWIAAFIVFWTAFAYAYEPFRAGTLHELSRTSWIRGVIPFTDKLYQWFWLWTATGSFCFLTIGFLLVADGYFFFGSLLADYAKLPLRKLFNGKICCIWGIVACSYVVFLCLAFWETRAYHRAIKDLEAHFGHPLTSAELERQFYEGRPANPAFWKQLEAALKEYYDSRDKNEQDFFYHPNAVFPEAIHAKRKKSFQENDSLQKLEQMLTGPIPPPKRNYADNEMLVAISTPELSNFRELARMERQRILFALEDGNFDAVSSALYRMDTFRDFLWKDHIYISYLVGLVVEAFRHQAMEKILASRQANDEWLTAQTARLSEVERHAGQLEEHFLFGESVSVLNIFHWLARYSGTEPDTPHAGLHYHSLRFFFPQGWWLTANEIKGMTRALRIHHFSELPAKRTGYIFTDMLLPALSKGTVKKQSIIASCRVLRGLIQVEQMKRRIGKYPDSIEGLPQDPFSEQPLKYKKGSCLLVEEVYQAKKEGNDEEDDLFSGSSYRFEKRERTIEAVQIWSVGPDGIDDGGLNKNAEYGSEQKSKDDIRFIIPVH
ncbi:MAG: hypothetical protein J6X55_07725 [Victivallales bacterium]|nr:hypothetical protein [Victivallales bacterium]